MRYRNWIVPEHGAEYAINLHGKGSLPAYSPELLSGMQRKPENELQTQPSSQQVDIHARGLLTLKAISYQEEQMIARITLSLTHFTFRLDGQLHEQITELFPRSLARQPALALLQPNQLVERFRLLRSESLPHSWMRRILTLMQCSVPAHSWTTYRANESDTFGRYIATYESSEANEPITLRKKRSRYIYTPHQRTAVGGMTIQCTPRDRQWWVTLDSKGLSALQVEIETLITAHTGNAPITQESINLSLQRRKQFRLSSSDRRQLLEAWDDKLRVEVMPWQPIEG